MSDPFSQAIQWLGRQASEESGRIETSTFVSAVSDEGVLHIEGLCLDATRLAYLEFLLLANSKNSSIRKLELIRCQLGKRISSEGQETANRNVTTTLQALISLLKSLPNLTTLDLSSNNLENSDMSTILDCLSEHALEAFNLEDNLLQGEEAGRLLRQFLRCHPTLTCLNLAENVLATKGALELAAALSEHGGIKDLNIACCEIARDDSDVWANLGRSVFEVLVDCLLRNPDLKTLRFSVTEAGMDESAYIPTADSCPSRSLVPPAPCESGTLAVARLLEEHPSLESLGIIQSPAFLSPQLPEPVNGHFATALGRCSTLKQLTLEGCGISGDTVRLLCNESLRRNTVLRYVDLLSNDLGEEGHQHLNQALPYLKNLRTLLVEGSTMDNVEDFVQAVDKNTSLTYVQAVDTSDVDITTQIDDITQRNDVLLKGKALLDDFECKSDGIWGHALARIALERHGMSAMFHIVSHKLWAPTNFGNPRKRRRLS